MKSLNGRVVFFIKLTMCTLFYYALGKFVYTYCKDRYMKHDDPAPSEHSMPMEQQQVDEDTTLYWAPEEAF